MSVGSFGQVSVLATISYISNNLIPLHSKVFGGTVGLGVAEPVFVRELSNFC
jgi:hypothetical protein